MTWSQFFRYSVNSNDLVTQILSNVKSLTIVTIEAIDFFRLDFDKGANEVVENGGDQDEEEEDLGLRVERRTSG